MNRVLHDYILKDLCPNGIWQLSDVVRSLIRYQMCRLPKNKVSEIRTRYPQRLEEMRAFLVKFFTRHYFQNQNSLVDYMTSNDFLDIVTSGRLQILDVGSGPAVASLAITEILTCTVKCLGYMGKWPKGKTVIITYVLNDISGICLGTGQQMLTNYFRIGMRDNSEIAHSQTISIQKAFPDNTNQLRRIMFNLVSYDLVIFSYSILPLSEDKGFKGFVNGLLNIEKFCNHKGRILILQDKFQTSLVLRMSRAIATSTNKQVLTQYVYPRRNENETYTYTYYHCLYEPVRRVKFGQNFAA